MNCCFCKKEIMGYGHNPWPADATVGSRCCADCNLKVVIPERIRMLGNKSGPSPTPIPKTVKPVTIQITEDVAKALFDLVIEYVDDNPTLNPIIQQIEKQLGKEN